MVTEKRQFRRFDIPLFIDFKPVKGVLTYSKGVTRDLSYDGFSFESAGSDFKLKENLKFHFTFPQMGATVSVLGNVVWKKKAENKFLAGIKLEGMDENAKREIFKKICVYGDISTERFFSDEVSARMPIEANAGKPLKKLNDKTKSVKQFIKSFLITSKGTGIRKIYLKSRPACRVTFRLSKDAAPDAQGVAIVGDFNNWDTTASPMKKLKNGDFTITLELSRDREYRFRYLIDGNHWENDWNADKYVRNPYGCDDSVVIV